MAHEDDTQRAIPNTPEMRTDGDGVTRRRPLRRRHVEETVDVAVPVRTAYNQWTQFKIFPRFSGVVRSVEQVRPTVTAWTLGRGPLRHRFAVEIVEQDPDAYLAWRGLEQHPSHEGEVEFRPNGSGAPRSPSGCSWNRGEPRGSSPARPGSPTWPPGWYAASWSTSSGSSRDWGRRAGAWRGTIRNGRVQHDRPEPPRSRVAQWPVG